MHYTAQAPQCIRGAADPPYAPPPPLQSATHMDLEMGRCAGVLPQKVRALLTKVTLQKDWILSPECLQAAHGVPGMKDRSYCRLGWSAHFNRGGADDGRFTLVELGSAALQRLAADVDLLSAAVSKLIPVTAFGQRGRRAAEGFQLSYGTGRGWHPDKPHLGDVIVTVTESGRCVVKVERVESANTRADAWAVRQEAGSYYGIWGDSRNLVKHCVVGVKGEPRLSLTLRYANCQPPVAAPAASSLDLMSGQIKRERWLAAQTSQGERKFSSRSATGSRNRREHAACMCGAVAGMAPRGANLSST